MITIVMPSTTPRHSLTLVHGILLNMHIHACLDHNLITKGAEFHALIAHAQHV